MSTARQRIELKRTSMSLIKSHDITPGGLDSLGEVSWTNHRVLCGDVGDTPRPRSTAPDQRLRAHSQALGGSTPRTAYCDSGATPPDPQAEAHSRAGQTM